MSVCIITGIWTDKDEEAFNKKLSCGIDELVLLGKNEPEDMTVPEMPVYPIKYTYKEDKHISEYINTTENIKERITEGW